MNPYGYYVELPDGRLSQITARVAFPVVNCYPSVLLTDIEVQSGFGSAAYFVYALREGQVTGPPQAIKLSQLRYELDSLFPWASGLSPPETFILVRLLEQGVLTEEQLMPVLEGMDSSQTLGQVLVSKELCSWEVLLAACLDIRSPNQLDPPTSDKRTFVREWELAGEILIVMGKISRSKLEYALRIKREANRTSGEILTAIGACKEEDVDEALEIQRDQRQAHGKEIGLIGELLVKGGFISSEQLNEALGRQNISGRPLSKVLVSMGYCSEDDIQKYKSANDWHSFQGEIEDNNLASWLVTRKIVDETQVQHAIRMKGQGRQMLGQILVASGVCSQRDVEEALAFQAHGRQNSGHRIEKIGNLLLQQGKVDKDRLEEAAKVQQSGRKILGEVLQAVGGCSEAAVRLAVEIQKLWREKIEQTDDRLGTVLQRRGFLDDAQLERVIKAHQESGKPMGAILVQEKLCTPEEIVAALVMRDFRRQCNLHAFVRKSLQALCDVEEKGGEITERMLQAFLEKTAH